MEDQKLKPEESRLIEIIRAIGFGEAVIVIKQGKPVMVRQVLKDSKLTD